MEILVHHPNQSNRSIFDENISKLIEGKDILIACPFLSYNYFNNVILRLCKNWKLLTNINMLFNSLNSKQEYLSMKNLFIENINNIHHCPNLHSKVIISDEKVIFGSANFTDSGINYNNELSILIDQEESLKIIKNWFNEWWNITKPISNDIMKNLLFDDELSKRINKNIISEDPLIKCFYNIPKNKTKILVEQKDENYLINFLRHINNKVFLNSYFDIAKHIIDKWNIQNYKNDYSKICITFREDAYRIPITIGQRYILNFDYANEKENIFLIMNKIDLNKDFKDEGLIDVSYYSKNKKDDVPYFHFYKDLNNLSFKDETIKQWEVAVVHEIGRCKKSSFRKYNQDILYKIITDVKYRDEIFKKL